MNTANVRAVLRIVGVLTIFAGTIGASLTVLGMWNMNRFVESLPPGADMHVTVTGISTSAILSSLVIAVWGAILYALSPAIARRITREPDRVEVEADLPANGEIARG